jgi:hypothetical protein
MMTRRTQTIVKRRTKVSDDDEDTVVWGATETIEFVDDASEEEGGESGYCRFCKDDPWVWLVKKQEILSYEDEKHWHLHTENWSRNIDDPLYQQGTSWKRNSQGAT